MWQYCIYLLILIFVTSRAAVQNLLETVRHATQKWYGTADRITTIDFTTVAKIHLLAMSIPIPRL